MKYAVKVSEAGHELGYLARRAAKKVFTLNAKLAITGSKDYMAQVAAQVRSHNPAREAVIEQVSP